jgi:hypothetical protein
MFVQTYGSALIIILFSLALGHAICVAVGGPQRWWAAPAVGLAASIILAEAAIKLPGKAVTAACVALLVLAGVTGGLVLRRGSMRVRGGAGVLRARVGDLAIGASALLVGSLPFLASGRVGLLGVSLDNDSDLHLLWAEELRSSRMSSLWGTQNGYPLGPHSLVATVGTTTSVPLNLVFTGLLVAVVPITAMTAAGVLAKEAWWRRALAGILCSLGYLLAAYYAEGAFKETILAALLLAFVLHLEQVRARWAEASVITKWRLLVPAVIIVAGAIYTYSYLGLAWFVLALTLWGVAELASHPRELRGWISRSRMANAAAWLGGAIGLGLVLLLPIAGQTLSFFNVVGASPASGGIPAGALGNLPGPLSGYEALGIWLSPDFRFGPSNTFSSGELSAFALAVAIYGLVWAMRRRQLLLAASVLGCGLIYWVSRRTQSPYVTAKSLVIATPVVMAVGVRGLLTSREGPVARRTVRLAAAALFCAAAGYSSYEALRNEPVQAPEPGRELAAFHRIIGDSRVLFLGDDDYSGWQLHASAVSALAAYTPSLGDASSRPTKQSVAGQSLDFDSVDPASLDRFRYVITTNAAYASQAPSSFGLLARGRLYELWKRTGPVAPRQVLEPPGSPGAILNCHSTGGRKIRHSRGEAAIMTPPVTVLGPSLLAGESAAVSLPLPKGQWELSVQYLSSFDLDLSARGGQWTMPAYLGRQGPFFGVGTVRGNGVGSPVVLFISARRPSIFTGPKLFASVSIVAATRLPATRQLVPLDQACGKYVDWYRLTGR